MVKGHNTVFFNGKGTQHCLLQWWRDTTLSSSTWGSAVWQGQELLFKRKFMMNLLSEVSKEPRKGSLAILGPWALNLDLKLVNPFYLAWVSQSCFLPTNSHLIKKKFEHIIYVVCPLSHPVYRKRPQPNCQRLRGVVLQYNSSQLYFMTV